VEKRVPPSGRTNHVCEAKHEGRKYKNIAATMAVTLKRASVVIGTPPE
jgi:hypothetical protein